MSLIHSYVSELFCRDLVTVIEKYHILTEYSLGEQYSLYRQEREISKRLKNNHKAFFRELSAKFKRQRWDTFTELRGSFSSLFKLVLPMLKSSMDYNWKLEIHVRRKVGQSLVPPNNPSFETELDDTYVLSIQPTTCADTLDIRNDLDSIWKLFQPIFKGWKGYWFQHIETDIPYNSKNDHSGTIFSLTNGIVVCSEPIS